MNLIKYFFIIALLGVEVNLQASPLVIKETTSQSLTPSLMPEVTVPLTSFSQNLLKFGGAVGTIVALASSGYEFYKWLVPSKFEYTNHKGEVIVIKKERGSLLIAGGYLAFAALITKYTNPFITETVTTKC